MKLEPDVAALALSCGVHPLAIQEEYIGGLQRFAASCAALAQEQAEPVCKCDLRTRLVGDGCEVCNPALAAEFAQEQAEPVALVRTWHKGEEQHAELLDWGIGVDALPDGEHTLYTALPQRHLPDWVSYDKTTDVLNIHGKKYAAAIFGKAGFLSPTGTVLRLEQSQPETIAFSVVPPPLNLNDPAVQKRLAAQWGYAPQRKPLTEEELDWALERHAGGADWSEAEYRSAYALARAIERAHGIGKGASC